MRTLLFVLVFSGALHSQKVSEGLVAHWTFDEDTRDQVIDSSPNGLHGTSVDLDYTDGPVSRAALFNGLSSQVVFPQIHAAPPDTIGKLFVGSIALWFFFERLEGGDILPLLYFGSADENAPHNSLIIEVGHNQDPNDTRLYFTIIVAPFDVVRFCFDTGLDLDANTWYHFAAVVGPEGNTGYLNGVELTGRRYNLGSGEDHTDFFSSVTSRELLALGYGRYGRNPAFFHLKGGLDDVRIYNRPLTGKEVQALFSMGSVSSLESTHPADAFLLQNHPNPFRNTTRISWHTTVREPFQLLVLDRQGKLLQRFSGDTNPPGRQEVLYHAGDNPAGIYYYRLQTRSFISTKPMIRIR